MRIDANEPPREFDVAGVHLRDCAEITLEPDEQVTFTTVSGAEHDVVRKTWGFYATASLNARLPAHGLRPVLVRNAVGRYFVLLVESAAEGTFARYARLHELTVVARLDDEETLRRFGDAT